MSIKSLFAEIFGPTWHEAESLVHIAEKEIDMLPQSVTDALNAIKAALSAHANQSAADAQTIASLKGQLADLQTQCSGHEATIADLTAKLADAQGQLTEIEAQLADMAVPAPTA